MIEGKLTSMGRTVTVTAAAVLLLALLSVTPAFAEEPWWNLTSGSTPTVLTPVKNEVQEVDLRRWEVQGGTQGELSVGETAAQAQTAFEGAYGAGNVEVTGGPVGSSPLIVTSVGASAGEPVPRLRGIGGEGSAKVLTEGGSGVIVVKATNLGDAPASMSSSPVAITDLLPEGVTATAITTTVGTPFGVGAGLSGGSAECSPDPKVETLLMCVFAGTELPPYESLEMDITVKFDAGGVGLGAKNLASISGGGARVASVEQPLSIGEKITPFGIESYEMALENDGGSADTQAGSHPFSWTTALTLNTHRAPGGVPVPAALVKDLRFDFPPGLIGDPTPFPQCSDQQFATNEFALNNCPADTAIGVSTVHLSLPEVHGGVPFTLPIPLFMLKPSQGEAVRLGFSVFGVPVTIDVTLHTGGGYYVVANVNNISETASFLGSQVTVWGVPGDPRHDQERGWECVDGGLFTGFGLPGCVPAGQSHPSPFLMSPTTCSGPLHSTMEADPWAEPGKFRSRESALVNGDGSPFELDGCNRLSFNPEISVAPDVQSGSTSSGLSVNLHVPQSSSLVATGLAQSSVRRTTVALPVGVGINPAAADGLLACSDVSELGRPGGEIELESGLASTCPDASKIGTIAIKTPLLPDPLEGSIFLAAQDANPFGTLTALYIVAEDPTAGVLVKLAGEVSLDEHTGQLVTRLEQPQLPFEDATLHFFGGDRAPLSTPALCGAYTTTASMSPWSGNEPATPSSTFDITSGPNGSPCASPLPFAPSLTAGTTSIQAGGLSPFTMTMSRPDGSQNLQAIKLKMPPGLLGTLATVKLCPEAQADAGTCGPESLIGHTTVSVGVGGDPYSVRGGEVFITEGYEGAPYGLSIVNPAKAGPFDLGNVVVRAKIEVDPATAVLTITTDNSGPYKIPTILDGIPLQIQHVNVSIDRPGFTFNPTNCSPLSITGSLTSDQGATQALSVPFQVTNCAVLAFKPKLTAKTAGKTSRAKGASLSVRLSYPAGPYDANIAKVKVDLPRQLPSRLETLQKACPAQTFDANPAGCPAASIVGHATATTPVLPVPLTGPAYFVSHGGEQFPDLIIVLQGYGATVKLVGSTFISGAGITSSTFKTIPDVPVGTFELSLPQGRDSALAANKNLCTTTKLAMPTSFVAQNGAVLHTSTPIVPTGCAKKTHKRSKHDKAAKHGKK